jgi:GIY-YIG catalytic domain
LRQELRQYRINAQKFYKNSLLFKLSVILILFFKNLSALRTSFLFNFTNYGIHKTAFLYSTYSSKSIASKAYNKQSLFSETKLESSKYISNLQSSLDKSSNPLNLFNAYGPGIYEIRCTENGKRYIGEAINVLDRLAKHTRNLEKGVADCPQLQLDWNLFGSSKFEGVVLYIGSEWADREVRLKKELEIISSYSPSEIYNSHPDSIKKNMQNYRIICEIEGNIYQSIAEASRATGERESKIRAKLFSNFPNYKVLDKIKHGYEPIIANGREYESIVDAVAAGEAKDRFEALRKLKNVKLKNWNYLSTEKYINK